MSFDEWRKTHWMWGSSTDEAKALRAWNSARENQDAEIERLKAALEAIDDHGRALSFIETLREKDAEIALLKEQLKAAILNLAKVAIEGGDET